MRIKAPLVGIGIVAALLSLHVLLSPFWFPLAPPNGTVLAQGVFVSGDTRGSMSDWSSVTGAVTIRATRAGSELTLGPFTTLDGPGLHVYLATDTYADEFIDLGALKAASGEQHYAVPRGTDFTKYKAALIWSSEFAVTYGYAPLH